MTMIESRGRGGLALHSLHCRDEIGPAALGVGVDHDRTITRSDIRLCLGLAPWLRAAAYSMHIGVVSSWNIALAGKLFPLTSHADRSGVVLLQTGG